jgi:hypothetical protein
MTEICRVCGTPVADFETFVVTLPSGKLHGHCVYRVAAYREQGYTVQEAFVLVARDLRAEARKGY